MSAHSFFFLALLILIPAQGWRAVRTPSWDIHTLEYSSRHGTPLLLDLRVPASPAPNCPAVLFVHGGGFQSGQRDALPVSGFLDALAEAGIVSASISYRLTMRGQGFGCETPTPAKQKAVASAGADLIEALDFLQNLHETTGLGSGEWVAAGSSAGAETALWSGYIDAPRRWAGVISFSGALDANTRAVQGYPPLLAIHGTCDALVPHAVALHHHCDPGSPGAWMLVGGPAWADSLRAVGVTAWTKLVCGGSHLVCNTAMTDPDSQDLVMEWLMGRGARDLHVLTDEDGVFLQGRSSCPQPCN